MASRFLTTNSSGSSRVDKGRGSVGWQNSGGGDCMSGNSGSDQHVVVDRGSRRQCRGSSNGNRRRRRAAVGWQDRGIVAVAVRNDSRPQVWL
ncbi:hypothetical protein NL676_014278 [Syzygium grande]|nr:hypothetical protein NL676_014278 [Syzygium grande]